MPTPSQGFRVTPAALNFGNVTASTSSPSLSVVVDAFGTDPATNINITPTDARFVATPSGNISIPNGTSLTVHFVFNASAVLGSANATYINFQGSTPPTSIYTLVANTVAPGVPVWNVTPGAINFGSLRVGTSSGFVNVTVTNTGAASLTLNSISLGSLIDFALTGVPSLPTTLTTGGFFIFQVKAISLFRGINDYSPGITLTPSVGPSQFVELIYTGFSITPAFVLTGATQGVLFGLSGTWDGVFQSAIAQALVNTPCEAVATWMKQVDFDNPGANTYMNKIFMRTEPSGNLGITLADTSMISGITSTTTKFSLVDQASDGNGLLKWLQFDMEQNGESHMFVFTIAVRGGILIMDLWIPTYEIRGPVYEGT